MTQKIPSKQYYDFKGWSLTKGSAVADFATYDPDTRTCTIINPQTFSIERSTILLYAVFENHPYDVYFHNPDGEVLAITHSTYGTKAKLPDIMPSIDESGLPLTQTYKFKGYSHNVAVDPDSINDDNRDYMLREYLSNVADFTITKDQHFYAVYVKESVYNEVTDLSYFDFEATSYLEANTNIPQEFKNTSYNIPDNGGWIITIKQGVALSGKITLPSYYQGKPVVQIGNHSHSSGFGCYYDRTNRGITHIFWKSSEQEPCKLRVVDESAFAGQSGVNGTTNIKYIELPEGLRTIGGSAFFYSGVSTISPNGATAEEGSIILPSTLASISSVAFNRAFTGNATINRIVIPSETSIISSRCFSNIDVHIIEFTFGTSTTGSRFSYYNDNYDNITFNIENIPEEGITNGQGEIFTTTGQGQIDSLIFYCNSTSKETAFQNVMNHSILTKGTITNKSCVRANDFIS